MNKKTKAFFFMSLMSCILLSGCDKNTADKKDYYVNADNVYVNSISNILSYDIVFLTKDKVKNVEYLSCYGENINPNEVSVTLIDNTLDLYRDRKTEDLYCSDWMIDMEFKDDGCYEIEGITLLVDGNEKNVKFKNPIKFNKTDGGDIFNEEFTCLTFPCEFSSSIIGSNEKISYKFESSIDCVLNGISVGDFLKANDVEYYVNKNKVDLPCSVKAGDSVDILFEYEPESVNSFSYVQTYINVNYEKNGESIERKGTIVFNPISPMDEKLEKLDSFVDYTLSK